MTVKEKIKSCVENFDGDIDNTEKIIALAYYIGREKATREVSDKYKELLKEQRERAKKCRYHKMAQTIIGEKEYIYCPGYGMEMMDIYGNAKTEV